MIVWLELLMEPGERTVVPPEMVTESDASITPFKSYAVTDPVVQPKFHCTVAWVV